MHIYIFIYMNMHYAGDLFMSLGDINGHVGRHIDGCLDYFGLGQTNFEGRMLLEFCLEKELCVKYMV